MLSYRHAFHAGNHADILKHATLTLILQSLKLKSKPFIYIDTHAGAGQYRLDSDWAMKTGEAQYGIGRLWQERKQFPLLEAYFNNIQSLNADYSHTKYPGSPLIAQKQCGPNERLILMELHPEDGQLLKQSIGRDKRAKIMIQDGFKELIAHTPPLIKRGLVLIDPPYEVKQDYVTVTDTLNEAYKRWATGVYAVWYPLLATRRDFSDTMLRKIKQGPYASLLKIEMSVSNPEAEFGMFGSGMLIVNAPWQLDVELKTMLPKLTELLALDEHRRWKVEWLINPK